MEYLAVNIWTLCFTLVGSVLLYKYFKQIYSHWDHQNVPHLKNRLVFGSYKVNDKPLHELERELYNEYGQIYGRYDGGIAVLSVGDPKLLKHVLVKDFHLFQNRRDIKFHDPIVDNTLFALEGEDWKRVRNRVSPTLTSAKLKRMLPLMEDCANVLVENISKTIQQNENVDCQKIFGAFTIDTIARCGFGMTINSLRNEDDPFVDKSKKLLECCLGWRTILTMICPQLMRLFRIRLLNPETTLFYRKIILQLVEERKHKKEREDFLQLLLDSQNETSDQNNNSVKSKCTDSNCAKCSSPGSTSAFCKHNKGLSHDEFIAQCVTFFIAGYDATTSLLSHAMYYLAVDQECQRKVFEEMDRVTKEEGGVINYESLSKMKYMEAVFNECLRLCPSMVRSERRVEKSCVLGDSNIALKKGMLISIPVYAIHRDPKYYPEPDAFKPERFYEPDGERPQYVHLPFGAGPRLCVGQRFVLMQVKLCLAKVLQRFHARPANTTPAKLGLTETRNVLKVNQVEICLEERHTVS